MSAVPVRLGWMGPAYLLFFLMLFGPTIWQPVKAVLLALVLGLVVAGAALRPRATLHRSVVLWTGLLILVGLFFMTRSLLRGEPGALAVGTVYALWPVLALVAIAGAASLADVAGFVRILVPATIAIGLYGLSFVLAGMGILPQSLFVPLDEEQAVGIYQGFVELRMGALATLVFTMPFLVGALVAWHRQERPPVAKPWLWAALVVGLALVALSGRRALLLVTVVAPLLTLFFVAFLPRPDRRRLRGAVAWLAGGGALLVVGLLFVLGDAYGLDPGAVWDMFRQGFDPRVDEAMSIRAVQGHEMLAAWSDRPFLGTGLGGFLHAHVRDPELPWAYELSYGALLFQTGLVGVALYAALLFWVYAQAARMIRAGGRGALLIVPLLVGLTTFLVANATNPYLVKFDSMWVLFLPLAVINRWLVERESAPAVRG